MIEYKMLTELPHECENKLNLWKEIYDLTILKMCNRDDGKIAILLLRTTPQPNAEKVL